MKYKSYLRNTKDYPPNPENPFIQNLIKNDSIKIIKKKNGKYDVIDKREFVKIFPRFFDLFLEMSSPEKKVFLYLISKLKYGDDYVVYIKKDCVKKCGFKQPLVADTAITGLLDKKVLFKSPDEHIFWLNSDIIMKGRIKRATMKHFNGFSYQNISNEGEVLDFDYEVDIELSESETQEEVKQETIKSKKSKKQVYKDIQKALGVEEPQPEYQAPPEEPKSIQNDEFDEFNIF